MNSHTLIAVDRMESLERIEAKLDALLAQHTAPPLVDELTVEQVSKIKGKSPATIRRWAASGKMPCVQGVRPYRFKAALI